MALFGIISSALFVVTGALLMVAGVVGWIGELRHE
jgi:hypothetical protein